MARTYLSITLALLVVPAFSSQACQLSLKPQTSGFFLNPTLEKVVVANAVAGPDKPCKLQVGDELLQVNDRVLPGAKAKEVMAYWKGLPKGSKSSFKVRRAGVVLMVGGK